MKQIARRGQPPTTRSVWRAIRLEMKIPTAEKSNNQKLRQLARVKWAAKLAGLELQTADLFKAANKKLKARAPEPVKAKPITCQDLKAAIAASTSNAVRLILQMAWLTASRVDDITKMKRPTVHQVPTLDGTMEVLLIEFGKTKMRKAREAREDHQVIVDVELLPRSFVKQATTWKKPDSATARKYKKEILQLLKMTDDLHGPTNTRKRKAHFTMHSIKRGATLALTEAAAAGHLPTALISTMAKHKRTLPSIQDTTIGYIDAPHLIAKAMNTDKATAILAKQIFSGTS